MSEAFPLPDLGGTDQRPLAAVPETSHPLPNLNFADHGGAELATRLASIPDEQFNATRHALEKSTSERETVRLIINYAADIVGILPSSDDDDYAKYQSKLKSLVDDTLSYYHEEFMGESGQIDIDKVIYLHDVTKYYNDSPILQALHVLKAHAGTIQPEYFAVAERLSRLRIIDELSDKSA